jgi:hypothetical protein
MQPFSPQWVALMIAGGRHGRQARAQGAGAKRWSPLGRFATDDDTTWNIQRCTFCGVVFKPHVYLIVLIVLIVLSVSRVEDPQIYMYTCTAEANTSQEPAIRTPCLLSLTMICS